MSKIELIHGSCADQVADVIVNAANDGDAVITPAFKLTNAKAIIHAVGPNFGVTLSAF